MSVSPTIAYDHLSMVELSARIADDASAETAYDERLSAITDDLTGYLTHTVTLRAGFDARRIAQRLVADHDFGRGGDIEIPGRYLTTGNPCPWAYEV